MSKTKEPIIENRITAEEARKLAPDFTVIQKFLSAIYAGIRTSAAKNLSHFNYTIYDEQIGDVNVLYGNRNAPKEKVLTLTGQECVKILEKDGYKVDLTLYYEERQFVDMRLSFTVSW